MAIGAVGAMQRLIEVTINYAQEREAFGRPIGKFQAIRHHVAEMATKAEAARALTYNALRLFHEGQDCIKEVTMAKLVTQRAVLEIADQSLQIHGGYGYMQRVRHRASSPRRPPRPDRRRHRRGDEGDPGEIDGAVVEAAANLCLARCRLWPQGLLSSPGTRSLRSAGSRSMPLTRRLSNVSLRREGAEGGRCWQLTRQRLWPFSQNCRSASRSSSSARSGTGSSNEIPPRRRNLSFPAPFGSQ